MNNSNYISTIEDADFEEINSRSLADAPSGQSRAIYDAIVSLGNTLWPNSPGQTFTAGLTAGGLASPTLNTYYWNNKQVIDGYFRKIDMKKLGQAIGPGVHESVKEGLGGPGLVAGLVAGFLIAKIISR